MADEGRWLNATRSVNYRALPADSVVRVYVRVMNAAARGRGLHLTADEVLTLSLFDEAVRAAADHAMEASDD